MNNSLASLTGLQVGISAGNSEHAAALGHLQTNKFDAIANVATELARALIYRGGDLHYGGDLRRDGFTRRFVVDAAEAYRSLDDKRDAVFVHHVAAPVWRNWSTEDAIIHLDSLRRFGSIRLYDGGGLVATLTALALALDTDASAIEVKTIAPLGGHSSPVDLEGDAFGSYWRALPVTPPDPTADLAAFEVMRKGMAAVEHVRLFFGGRHLDNEFGWPPGVLAEAALTVESGAVALPFPAFGGAAQDVALALGVIDQPIVPIQARSVGHQSLFDRIAEKRADQALLRSTLNIDDDALAIAYERENIVTLASQGLRGIAHRLRPA